MVNTLALLASALPLASAYPFVAELNANMLAKRRAPNFVSGRSNTGVFPSTNFDAEDQFVDVGPGSGHEFQSPGPSDLRGQCPGLNAAANHGFLPRSGIASITDTIEGLGALYNMAPDLSLVLAVVSVALAGDYVTTTWSIGGAYTPTLGLLGEPQGIVGTHNRYEGDASPVRGDAYLNDGQVGVFQMRSWNNLYNLGEEYTLDMLAAQNYYTHTWSVENNPYYFSAPFSGLVTPAAHNFIINFMSNHSAEVPGGTLTRDTLKSFFAVTGEPGSFVHNIGQEQIPMNWYRRPSTNQYTVAATQLDVLTNNAMYPGIVSFGGNTGTVNSFAGVDTGDLTGGIFNAAGLLEGNNLTCFALQATQAGQLDQLGGLFGAVGDILAFLTEQLKPIMSELSCPELADFNSDIFDQFPGASYQAQGQ